MYTLFLQKKKGDQSPFPLTKNLYDFLKCTKANGIFICPGHLSKNDQQIEDLLKDLLSVKTVQAIGIGNKYTANSLPLYEKHIGAAGKLWEVDRNGISDHRKMVFVFRYTDPLPKLERNNLTAILNQIEIIGVAIGSSNFSYPTYGPAAPGTLRANKGEADIFMFWDERETGDKSIPRYISNVNEMEVSQNWQHHMVLSKSINKVPLDFFRQMFEETLEMTLN